MSEFDRARRAAFMSDLLKLVTNRPSDLLPFDEVQDRLRLRSLVDRGLREVPLDQIVGSLGRAREFNRAFLPRQEASRERWRRVADLAESAAGFPPVELYQVGDAYFVIDGHHRISVARRFGAATIEAYVKEWLTPVPLDATVDVEELVLKQGLAQLLECTGLKPREPTELVSTLGNGYERLLDHIHVHRHYLGLELQREISWDEAVRSWYDNLYRPMIELIRRSGIGESFPERTSTDLYLFTMDHLHHLRRRYGDASVEPEAAVEDLSEGQGSDQDLGRRFRAWLQETRLKETETSDEGVP